MSAHRLCMPGRPCPGTASRWPWLLMSGPAIVVVAALATAWLACVDRRRRGGRRLLQARPGDQPRARARSGAARCWRVGACSTSPPDGARARGARRAGRADPAAVRLRLAHPTRAGLDRTVTLAREAGRRLSPAASTPLPPGRWLVIVETDAWRLPAGRGARRRARRPSRCGARPRLSSERDEPSIAGGRHGVATVAHRLMWVIWPAFLVAGVAEVVFFTMFDPFDLHFFGAPLDLSRGGDLHDGLLRLLGTRHRVVGADAVPRAPADRGARREHRVALAAADVRRAARCRQVASQRVRRSISFTARPCTWIRPSCWKRENSRLTVSSFRPR